MLQNFEKIDLNKTPTLKSWCDERNDILTRPTMVFHNDFPVPRSKWEEIELSKNSVITVCEIVQGGGGGGGSNPLQLVMMVVVVAAAIFVPQIMLASGFLPGFAGLSVGANMALWGAGIMLAGSFAMNMMFSSNPATPSAGQLPTSVNNSKAIDAASPTYSLSAQNNTARLNQMIPECFGTNLQVLDLGASPYSRYASDEEYLQELLVIGMGEYDVKTIYIEDTPIWKDGAVTGNFPEVQVEIINPGEQVTLFKPNVEVAAEVSGQQLEDDGDSLGFFAVSPPNIEVDEIEISLAMILAKPEPTVTETTTQPDGSQVNETTGGGLSNVTLTVLAQAQKIDNLGDPVGSPITLFNKSYSYATYDTKRLTETITVPKARYSVKLTRVSTEFIANENDPENIADQIRDALYWTGAAGFVPEELTFDEGTMIAIRAKASNALNQNVARSIKALHQRKLPLYVNGSWTAPTATDSTAAAISYTLKSKYGGRLTDSVIDLDALWTIDANLQAQNYGICGIVDSSVNTRSLLADFCSSNQIIIRLTSSGISFLQDIQRTEIKYSFDETNTVIDSFKYETKFANEVTVPDWLAFDYFDPDTGYTLQQVPCKLIDAKNVQPTSNRAFVKNRAQAFYEGMRELLAYRYRQKYVSWTTGMEGFRRNFGDIVTVSNLTVDYSKRPTVGEVSEVQSKYVLELDRPVVYDAGEEHLITFTKKDGTQWGPCKIDSIAVETNYTLIGLDSVYYESIEALQGPMDIITGYNVTRTKFNLHTGSRKSDNVFLTDITPVDEKTIDLGGFIDDERAYTYKSYAVPELDVIDETTASTVVEQLTVSTSWIGTGANVTASWLPVQGAHYYTVEWSSDSINWVQAGKPTGSQLNFLVNSAQIFYVRVSAMLEFQGPWAIWVGSGVEGSPSIPEPVVTSFVGGQLEAEWPIVPSAADYITSVRTGSIVLDNAIKTSNTISKSFDYRNLSIYVAGRNSFGISDFGYTSVSNLAPVAPANLAHVAETWQVTWDASEGANGYIAMIGSTIGFDSESAIEIITTENLTVTFASLTTGTYYVRVAAKDLFYDNKGGSLNWSEIEI